MAYTPVFTVIIILGDNSPWLIFRVVYFSYLFTIKTLLQVYDLLFAGELCQYAQYTI